MPERRHAAARRAHRVTDEVIRAYRERDYLALHQALNLRPWMPSPLPLSVDALGVDPDRPPAPGELGAWPMDAWALAVELQRELEAALREAAKNETS